MTDKTFEFGNPKVNAAGFNTCCGKPVGCTMSHVGCAFLRHPWKREHVLDKKEAE